MVRKVRGLLAYGSPKPQQKPSFKQRYDEAERRRAAIVQRLAGLNETRARASRLSARVDIAQSNLSQGRRSPSAWPRCRQPSG